MILRAAVHIHSTWSYDGRWTLDQIVPAFAARGYNVLLMTEHDLGFTEERRRAHRDACQRASTDRILVIPGIEYGDPSNTVHTLVWGDLPFLGAGRATHYVLEHATAAGGVCVFAHPSRREAWKCFRQDWLNHLAGIEVWNRKTDGWSPSRDGMALVADTAVPPIVGLDFHNPKQFFPLAVRLFVEGQVEEANILDALRRRLYDCEAFGMDMKAFLGGFGLSGSGMLEATRRLAARALRRALNWLPRTTAKAAPGTQGRAFRPPDQTMPDKVSGVQD